MKNLKIIRVKELCQLISVSPTTLWRMSKRGELPPRIKISTRAVGWRESDIEEWLENRPEPANQEGDHETS